MKKVIHVLSALDAGGIETLLLNIAHKSNNKLFINHFIVFGDKIGTYEKQILELGCTIHHIPQFKSGVRANFKALKKVLQENNYDAMHFHDSSMQYVFLLAIAKKYKISVRILHSHASVSANTLSYKFIHLYLFFMLNTITT
ncbi:MAG: hypothetical protein ACRCTA_01965, partial [Bacilli bacterium]